MRAASASVAFVLGNEFLEAGLAGDKTSVKRLRWNEKHETGPEISGIPHDAGVGTGVETEKDLLALRQSLRRALEDVFSTPPFHVSVSSLDVPAFSPSSSATKELAPARICQALVVYSEHASDVLRATFEFVLLTNFLPHFKLVRCSSAVATLRALSVNSGLVVDVGGARTKLVPIFQNFIVANKTYYSARSVFWTPHLHSRSHGLIPAWKKLLEDPIGTNALDEPTLPEALVLTLEELCVDLRGVCAHNVVLAGAFADDLDFVNAFAKEVKALLHSMRPSPSPDRSTNGQHPGGTDKGVAHKGHASGEKELGFRIRSVHVLPLGVGPCHLWRGASLLALGSDCFQSLAGTRKPKAAED